MKMTPKVGVVFEIFPFFFLKNKKKKEECYSNEELNRPRGCDTIGWL